MFSKIMKGRWYYILLGFITGELIIGIFLYIGIKNHNMNYNRPGAVLKQKNTRIVDKSLYEYYGIKETGENPPLIVGLETFFINGKSLTILSGAIHYFRVHPEYWRDRLKKLRAMGANTVETYIPWNLHEPEKDCYDFGEDISDNDKSFSAWLNVANFLQIAKEEDLFAIIRPGPYICSEWDFGGLPSYLLSYPDIRIRSNHPLYLERVDKFFDKLLPKLSPYRIENGGPIIMFQLENEYGHFAEVAGGTDHLKYLKLKMQEHDINGLFVTSDGVVRCGSIGSLIEDDVLMTANFQSNCEDELVALKSMQPTKAAMVMEFWTGWFDHWGEPHSIRNSEVYAERLHYILEFPASVNLYMFHGGTNFGFMNGANQWMHKGVIDYQPDTTSYDYDALLSEHGDYTEKYFMTRDLFLREQIGIGIRIPSIPDSVVTVAYHPIVISEQLEWNDIIDNVFIEDRVESTELKPMELLPLKGRKCNSKRGGQSYGFILYRQICVTKEHPVIQIMGRVRDVAMVLIDNVRQTDIFQSMKQVNQFGFWGAVNAKKRFNIGNGTHVLDILVENLGRNNFGFSFEDFDQRKGLIDGIVKIDDIQLSGVWSIMVLDFQPKWVTSVKGWKDYIYRERELEHPTMFKATFELEEGKIFDTYINMEDWGKGVVFVNGFNIGRYFSIGPQLALYVPAPLLKTGVNTIIIFEQFSCSGEVDFSSKPIFV
ncbi:beta-galactosidase-1-like protein 2 [Lycorma delicatula]|uniref:beta-galactosidase-1-like protein 2 n=1 Tax=Lycorma delicatula TaxID=130591 RepID=UPI003F514934